MAREKILVMILAGGKGSRLETLTEERAKPALPFGGTYRLIDFALSNCVHSGLSDVWVVEQYQLHSLNDHLANGRPWDLDRTYGGLQVLPPFTGDKGHDEAEVSRGNADALCRHRHLIRDFAPDLLIVLSADHVYKLDFRDVIDRHRETGAALTLVTTRVPLAEASRFGTVEVDPQGKVTAFAYKPQKPESDLVTTEVFVYFVEPLLRRLDELAESDKELGDFGDELLPGMVAEGKVYEHRLEGYWRDVGTIESYWQGHQDLLAPEAAFTLDEPDWPILTYGVQRRPARINAGAEIEDSLISPGCTIQGRVVRSVLAPGVFVGPGALVRDSVVLHDTRIGEGAVVVRAIVDERAEIAARARVGQAEGPGGDITLIARGARIAGVHKK
jgi:glucose-1-phosphate adenylyltransferase